MSNNPKATVHFVTKSGHLVTTTNGSPLAASLRTKGCREATAAELSAARSPIAAPVVAPDPAPVKTESAPKPAKK
jgi:hypothetical protein